MRFVDEPIEVDVHISAQGEVRPTSFTWRKRTFIITGLGRASTKGDERHFLVMTAGDRIFELRWHVPANRWFLARASEGHPVA